MDFANQIILLGGGLLLVSILAGLISSRVGAPLLLVFLGLGMLFGEEGPGGLGFHDFNTAFLIGSMALAVILFDGGLRTPMTSIRVSWGPASILATLGVMITAAVTGLLAVLILDVNILTGLLIGSIVASTDAAAVFLLLHQRGMELKKRVATTLEVESGVNDPMAVFLTITLVELLATGASMDGGDLSLAILGSLGMQMGLGAVMGLAAGYLLAWAVNRLELAPGLYPVFVIAGAMVVFGGTQQAGGSGFLAVYLAGIIAGNQRLRANSLIRRFHDGLAWVSQIVMFVMLGLLVTPSALVKDLLPGALVALVLIFIARPIAVFLCLWPFRFSRAERLFISWVGLRGAVPIFLGVIPILGGVEGAQTYVNVAFIVVLASLLLQGWTVSLVARRLDVEVPPMPEPTGRLDLDMLGRAEGDLVGYSLREGAHVIGRQFRQIHRPRGVRLLAVLREDSVLAAPERQALQPGDYVLMLCPPEHLLALDKLFLPRPGFRGKETPVRLGDFQFDASIKLGAIADEYDLPVTRQQREMTLGEFMAAHLDDSPSVGDRVRLGAVELIVRETEEDQITEIGIRLDPHPAAMLEGPLPVAVEAVKTAAQERWEAVRRRLTRANRRAERKRRGNDAEAKTQTGSEPVAEDTPASLPADPAQAEKASETAKP